MSLMMSDIRYVFPFILGATLMVLLNYCTTPSGKGVAFKLDNATTDYAEGMKTGLELCGNYKSVEICRDVDGGCYVKATFK